MAIVDQVAPVNGETLLQLHSISATNLCQAVSHLLVH